MRPAHIIVIHPIGVNNRKGYIAQAGKLPMDSRILENIGLSRGEIKVYLALLRLGETSSGPLIIKSGVARSKVYDILEKLKGKGLASEAIVGDTRHFQAASPEKIAGYMARKRKELEVQEAQFKKVLPELLDLRKSIGEKQEAKAYVGFEGIETFFDEALGELEKGGEYLALTFSDRSVNSERIGRMFRRFHQRRAAKRIRARILVNEEDVLSRRRMDFSDTGFYEFRSTEQKTPTGVAIFGDIVATVSWGETPRVFVVACRENAEQYRKFFQGIWKDAEPVR